MEVQLCPRCEAAVIADGRAALSRVTRDEGAEVYVCVRCGEREGLYGRDPANHVQLHEWPVDVNTLVLEERTLIERFRGATIASIPVNKLELGDQ